MLALRLTRGAHPAVQLRRLLVAAASAGTSFLFLCALGHALGHPGATADSVTRLVWSAVPLAATIYFAVAVARTDPATKPRPGLSAIGLGPLRLMVVSAATTALSCTLGSMLALLVFLHLRGDLSGLPFDGAAAGPLASNQPLPVAGTLTLLAIVPVCASAAAALALRPREAAPAAPRPSRMYGRFGAYRRDSKRETFGAYGRFGRQIVRPVPGGAADPADPAPQSTPSQTRAGEPAGAATTATGSDSGSGAVLTSGTGPGQGRTPDAGSGPGAHPASGEGSASGTVSASGTESGSGVASAPRGGVSALADTPARDAVRAVIPYGDPAGHPVAPNRGGAAQADPGLARQAGEGDASSGGRPGNDPSDPVEASRADGARAPRPAPSPAAPRGADDPAALAAALPDTPGPGGSPTAAPTGLPWGITLLAAGLAVETYTSRTAPAAPDLTFSGASPGVLAGWALAAVGLALAGPGLTHLCGRLLQSARPGALRLLAGRILMAEADRIGRPLGVVSAVLSAAWAMALLHAPDGLSLGPLTVLGVVLVTGCTVGTLLTAAVETRQVRADTTDALLRLGAPATMLRGAAALRAGALLALFGPLTLTVAELAALPLAR
ncbi:hypothetical protein ACIGAN_13515 [Streptomyces sp. NPDC085931]|uniref:hypothetical protein n=1 Tax=Streptomyces sp. NPDC085931 TaxID=3365740 RepID=UPI0037D28D72